MTKLFGGYKEGEDVLRQGDLIVSVRNDLLAACLMTLGVPTWNNKQVRPYTCIETAEGEKVIVWAFKRASKDGRFTAPEIISLFYKREELAKDNPEHPLCYAIAAVTNIMHLLEVKEKARAKVAFHAEDDDGTPGLLTMFKDSPAHLNAIEEGLKRA